MSGTVALHPIKYCYWNCQLAPQVYGWIRFLCPSIRPYRFTVEVGRAGGSPFSTPCSSGGMMAAWMSPSTGNQCTQTSTWTSTPAIHPRSRGDWLSACSTEQLAEGETPSYQSPEAERVPHCLHPLLFQPPQTGHGGN